MVPLDPEASPPEVTIPPPQGDDPEQAATGLEQPPEGLSRLLTLALAAGLIAGVASVLVGEMIMGHYRGALNPPLNISPDPEHMRRWRDARLYSATLSFATLAGLLGLAMGLAGGLARRAAFAGVRAAITGLLLGIAVVASMSLVLVPNFFTRYDPQSGDLVLPLLTHGAIWSAVGAIGGLALGLGIGGQGRWKATLAGALVGAAAATVTYEIIGALAFASSKTDLPLSSSVTTRGMAQLLVAILSATGAVLALYQPARRGISSSIASQ